MLRPKKNKIAKDISAIKVSMKKMRKQLGHVRGNKDANKKLLGRVSKQKKKR